MKTLTKFFLGALVSFFTLAILSGVGVYVWAMQEYTKHGDFKEAQEFIVPSGAHIGLIAEALHDDGLIENTQVFKYAGKITGQAPNLKAGEYLIPAQASVKDILDLLESGKTILRKVTIREGLTNYEINRLLSEEERLKQVEVSLLKEGRYLPETYTFQKGETNADILSRMADAMDTTLNDLWDKRQPDLPIKTKEEALILASIVEKETAVPDERKRVAGVFINRLKRGMPLQTDPTVIYAITKGEHKNDGQGPLGRRLLKKDLKFDSPYNTYLYPGLPPGPIANPGRASIEATLNPEKHDYIYFVADGSGGHAFAKTLAEHNANVAKWRKIRKNSN